MKKDFAIRAAAHLKPSLTSPSRRLNKNLTMNATHHEKRPRFIERNCLASLAGLARSAPRLATLDAGANRVAEVEVEGGSECLPRTIETLRLSGNDLSGPGALRGLFRSGGGGGGGGGGGRGRREGESAEHRESGRSIGTSSSPSSSRSLLPLLSTLDLSHCSVDDADTLLSLLESLPSLRALYLQGTPFWESIGSANHGGGGGGGGGGLATRGGRRLAVLAAAPRCTYLNDAPVFGDERAAADAFRESAGSLGAASAARGRFLEAAALAAERTARLLERPPRFARSVEEEEGGEERDDDDDDLDEDEEEEEQPDDEENEEEEEQPDEEEEDEEREECQRQAEKDGAESGAAAAATATASASASASAVLEKGKEAEA
jgi:hypothetical protein